MGVCDRPSPEGVPVFPVKEPLVSGLPSEAALPQVLSTDSQDVRLAPRSTPEPIYPSLPFMGQAVVGPLCPDAARGRILTAACKGLLIFYCNDRR